MNHIYKSIFNKALGVFTAVPEFASAHGKGSERTVVGRVAKGTAGFAASALAISVGLALTSTSAVAGPGIYINDGADNGCIAVPDAAPPYVGIYGLSNGAMYPAASILGTGQQLPPVSFAGLDVMKPCLSSGANATAVEKYDSQTNRTLFYGKNAPASVNDNGAKNLTLGGRLDVNSGIIGVGDRGVNGTDATNSIRMGTGTTLADANKKLNSISIGVDAGASATSSTAIGANAKARADYSVALGDSAVSGDNTVGAANGGGGAIAIGRQSMANNYNAIAIGMSASVSPAAGVTTASDGIAIGSETVVDNYKGIAVGAYSQAKGRQSTVIANNVQGSNYSTASGDRSQVYGAETNVSGNNSVAIGDTNTVASDRTYAIGNNINVAAGTNDSLVFGTRASVGGANAIALGNTANAKTNDAISIGSTSISGDGDVVAGVADSGGKSIAIGYESVANRYNTVAIGMKASTRAADSTIPSWDAVAVGVEAAATTYKALAVGAYTQATGRQSTVIGNNLQGNPSIASGDRSQVYGVETTVSGNNSVAIGDKNTVASARTYAIGNNINVAAGANDSLAFGTRAHVSGANQVSIGKDAGADAAVPNTSGIVIGESAGRYLEGGTRNTAIGERAGQYVKGSYNIAMGTNAGSRTATDTLVVDDSTSIGHNAKAVTSESIAIGKNAESGKVDKFDGKKATAIGHEAKALGTGNIAMGAYATSENGHDGVAIGTYVKSSNVKAIAIGAYSSASGVQSIAIANNYNSDNSYASNKSTATGVRAIVMGAESHATAERALAIGDKNTVASARTYAIGNNINVAAGADDSLVFGTRAAVGAENTVAIGANANAAQANSVALGAGSATSDVNTGDYTLTTSYTAAGQPVAANGTVSVGSAGKERQIQNVAAGVISATSTDAINGSQLYATNNYMNNFAGDVKTKLGGNAALGNDGHLTMTNIGGTGENTVDDAIKNLKTAIDNKADTTASVTSENQADIKVDKEAPVGNTTNYKLSLGNDAKAKLAKAATALQTVEGDSNITATKDATDPTKVKLALNKNLTADSLTLGDKAGDHAVVNKDGLTIANGPSVKKDGINAGNKKITGVADGNVVAGSTDAVNGGQLAEVKSKADSAVQNVVSANPTALTATKAGDTVTLTPNFIAGDLVNPATGAVNTPAAGDAGKLVTAGTVANALANTHFVVDTAKTDGELDAASKHDQKIKSGNKVTLQAGKNLKAKQTNGANGAEVEFSLKDSISLKEVKVGEGSANEVVLNNNGVNVAGNTYINKDGLNANDKKITNVAPGAVTAASKDAVNGSQLYNVANNVKDLIGPDAKIDPATGKVTVADPAKGIGETGKGNIGDAIKHVNDAAKAAAETAAKHTTVVEGKNVKVTKGKNAAGGDEYTVATKDDLDVTSVTAGNTTVNTNGLTITGGPSVTRGGIDAGNRVISGVKAGDVSATSQEAVNGSQLHATNTKLDGVKAKADTAVQDVKSGDENALTAVKDPNTNIVTVTPKLSGDLVDANGNITAPTTPADKGKLVTAGTVADALANTHFVVDTKATDGELDAASQADQKIKAGNKVTLQAGKNLKAKQTNGANGAQVEFSLKDSISLKEVTAGEGTNQVVLGNDGVKVGGNTYINNAGLNANGNKITNVADGVDPTDAVNKGQLDAVKGVADSAVKSVDVANGEQNLVVDNTDPKNPKLSLKKDLTVDSVKAGDTTVNNDGLTIAGGPSVKKDGIDAADKKITNVAAGDVAENSKDAVNGGQLYDVAKNVADLVGPDAKIDPATGKVTVADPAKGIGETGKGNIGDAIKHVNDLAKNAADTAKKHTTVEQGDNIVVEESTNAEGGKHYKVSTAKNLNVDSVKAGDTTVNNDGVTINNGPSMTKDGINANNTKVTNVVDGVDAADAVNKGQLDKVDTKVSNVAQNVVNVLGGDATVNGNGDITMSNIGETGKGNINDAIKSVNDLAKKAAAEKTSVKAKEGRSNVTVTEGVNAAGGHEYTVDVERSVTNAGSDYVTVTNNHDADSNTTTYTVDVSAKTKASLAKADSAVQGLTSKDGNLNFTKGSNGNVEVSFNDNLNVKNVTTDRVQVANGPSMSKDGINAAGKAISNVANGNVAADSKDAVNGGQLHETAKSVADVIGGGATVKDGKVVAGQNGIGNTGQNTVHGAIAAINQNTANNFNQIRGDLRKMDRDLRGGIAGALATAGLPQAFRPGKSMVAAAASTYRGQSGLAIGVSRISDNGKVILKVTGNTNSRGDFGGTIGAGYQW